MSKEIYPRTIKNWQRLGRIYKAGMRLIFCISKIHECGCLPFTTCSVKMNIFLIKQTQRRTEDMLTSSITSETIQGVLIEGCVLEIAVAVIMMIIQAKRNWTVDESTEARSYCKY